MVFSEKDVQCLSAGAHILGGGGGGQKSRGLKTAEDALQIGTVRMVDAADLCDGDILVTVPMAMHLLPQHEIISNEEELLMKKIGLITIGQTPRDDVIPDIAPLFSSEVELLQAGALDGLTAQDIAMFAPQEGDYVLISRLHDGSPVVFAEKHILPRLQSCIDELEARGVELILFLCTGSFPAFHSNVPLVFPCKVLNGVVPALAAHSRIAVITPKEEQKKQCEDKWNEYVSHVQVVCASPYGDSAELECACELLKETDVDLIVLDCIGYTAKMKAYVQMHTSKRVVLSRTVAARVVMELLS